MTTCRLKAATVQPVSGCTLATYAEVKRLPESFLRQLGVSDISISGEAALRIPYRDEAGNETAVRFRLELKKGEHADNRFRWRKGSKPRLYGLWRLEEARAADCFALVEGESDAQTLWYHGVPALGIPGAACWREEWASELDGIGTILVVIEPDRGGEAIQRWLTRSSIRDRVQLVTLEGAKDPSEMYLADPARFADQWRAAVERAVPWADQSAREARTAWEAAREKCGPLARSSRILDELARDLPRAGLAGEERAAKLIFLCLVSRLLERPVSAAIKGPSSAGKSHVTGCVLKFVRASAYHAITAMSPRALAYSDEPLEHRMLVLYEAAGMAGEFQSYLIRTLLSEGHVRYETVERTSEGLKPRVVERQGPTGLLVTTTATRLDREVETRIFSIPVCDTRSQTQRVLSSLAARAQGTMEPEVDFTPWHALQDWLEGAEHAVSIPYASDLATRIAPAAVRLRRDFGALLQLIGAHALLHQASRERDLCGHVVASLEDYAVVRELVGDLIGEGTQTSVPQAVRETVEAVASLTGGAYGGVTSLAVANHLALDKSSSLRRLSDAAERGYVKNNEERRGQPGKWVPADPMPGKLELLPAPHELEAGCAVASEPQGESPSHPSDITPEATGND